MNERQVGSRWVLHPGWTVRRSGCKAAQSLISPRPFPNHRLPKARSTQRHSTERLNRQDAGTYIYPCFKGMRNIELEMA